jgi:hypothetical protein
MIIADEIKAARKVLKKAQFQTKSVLFHYGEEDIFSIHGLGGTLKVSREEMEAVADWVLCLFIDDGEK